MTDWPVCYRSDFGIMIHGPGCMCDNQKTGRTERRMPEDNGQNENDTKAFPLPAEDPELFSHAPESMVPESLLKAAAEAKMRRVEEVEQTDKAMAPLPSLNRFMFADTTDYFKTMARFLTAQTRFLRTAALQADPHEYNASLEQYSLAQGDFINACQALLHQIGVI
jgi:hypothetical protein